MDFRLDVPIQPVSCFRMNESRLLFEPGRSARSWKINYVRHLRLRARTWQDNALVHHAAHAIDLVMHWCGGLSAIGCVACPASSAAHATALLGRLPNGGYASIAVSYVSRLPHARMLIVGSEHTVETDGFSYIDSDLAELRLKAMEQEVYKQAICKQDQRFLAACRNKDAFIDWAESVRLVRTVTQFRSLSDRANGHSPDSGRPAAKAAGLPSTAGGFAFALLQSRG